MNAFHDPEFWRAAVRLLLAAVGAWFGFLGYRLFVRASRRAPDGATPPAGDRSSVGAAWLLIGAGGLAVAAASWPGRGPSPGGTAAGASGLAQRSEDRAQLLRQIAVLQQTEKQYQRVIADLKTQIAILRNTEPPPTAMVEPAAVLTNTVEPETDLNTLYSQMMELTEQLQQLQAENEALRAALAGSRSDAAP